MGTAPLTSLTISEITTRPRVVFCNLGLDGFSAAWAIYKHRRIGADVSAWVPWDTKSELTHPAEVPIVFLDCCPRLEVLRALLKTNPVLVLDRHETTKTALESVDWSREAGKLDFVVCLDHSSAWLAWQFFHSTDPPKIIGYVEDIVLQKFALPSSEKIGAWLRLFPKTFEAWDEAATILQQNFDVAECHGAIALRVEERFASSPPPERSLEPAGVPEGEGRKDDAEKIDRYDLIPPEALRALARLYGIGARKYAARNWEKGIAYGRVYRALLSHLETWRMGEDWDPDGQHHLDSVIWNAVALRTYEARGMGARFDDLRVSRPLQNTNSAAKD